MDSQLVQERSGAPQTHVQTARPDHDAVAAAIERRLQEERERAAAATASSSNVNFDGNHGKRQEFRRMIDPGILRPNPRHIALESLQTLLKLAENIIAHPEDPKYQKFKPTNATINRLLVEPRGTLEFAVAIGFSPQVENFQPFYVFNRRRLNDLKIGAAIIKEALDRELPKEEKAARKRAEEKAAHEAAVAKVKQAFYDDRKGRAITDEREREARVATAATRAAGGMSPEPEVADYRPKKMPGSGHTLSGNVIQADEGSDEESRPPAGPHTVREDEEEDEED